MKGFEVDDGDKKDSMVDGRHAWISNALFNLAAYADRQGLVDLHQKICDVLSSSIHNDLFDPQPVAVTGSIRLVSQGDGAGFPKLII